MNMFVKFLLFFFIEYKKISNISIRLLFLQGILYLSFFYLFFLLFTSFMVSEYIRSLDFLWLYCLILVVYFSVPYLYKVDVSIGWVDYLVLENYKLFYFYLFVKFVLLIGFIQLSFFISYMLVDFLVGVDYSVYKLFIYFLYLCILNLFLMLFEFVFVLYNKTEMNSLLFFFPFLIPFIFILMECLESFSILFISLLFFFIFFLVILNLICWQYIFKVRYNLYKI